LVEARELGFLSAVAERLGRGARIVDSGCGTGVVGAYFGRLGSSVIGLDTSWEMMRRARYSGLHVLYACGDMRSIPVRAETADAYLAWYSLIHLERDEVLTVLAEAARALKPGGLCAVAVHESCLSDDAGINGGWMLVQSFLGSRLPLAIRLICLGELEQGCQLAGLHIERIDRRDGNAAVGELGTRRLLLLASKKGGL
jgi:SAM-dependent methyltransferase